MYPARTWAQWVIGIGKKSAGNSEGGFTVCLFKESSLQLSRFIFQSPASCTSYLTYFAIVSLHCRLLCRHQTTAQGWNFASASDRPRNAPESLWSSSSSTVYGIQICFSNVHIQVWKTEKRWSERCECPTPTAMSSLCKSCTGPDFTTLSNLQKPILRHCIHNHTFCIHLSKLQLQIILFALKEPCNVEARVFTISSSLMLVAHHLSARRQPVEGLPQQMQYLPSALPSSFSLHSCVWAGRLYRYIADIAFSSSSVLRLPVNPTKNTPPFMKRL